MNNDSPLRFEYKVPTRFLIPLMAVSIALAVFMAHIAQTNASPPLTGPLALIIPPSAMPIIDWGLSAFFCLITILLFYAFLKQSNAVDYIELGPNGALVQIKSITKSMSQVTIPYQSIKSIQVNTVKKHNRVVISSSVGDTLLDSRCFSTPSDFTAFLSTLDQRRQG